MAKARRDYHHGDLEKALVDASIAILREEGVGGLTLRSAARRVGVSHSAPKNHFGDLAGLLAAVAEAGFWRLHAALAAADAPPERSARARKNSGAAVARLLAIGVAYVRFAIDSPGHFRAMFHPSVSDRAARSGLDDASRATFGVLVNAVARAQKDGEIAAGDAIEQSLAAWSIVHGLSTLAVDQHLARKGFVRDPVDLAAAVTMHLFKGLRASSARGHAL
jgi:AcrR family transcriptional regulator